jgi:TolA-binding protein
MKLLDTFARERRLRDQEKEIRELRQEIERMRAKNERMQEGMRRCVSCEYRLEVIGRG